MSHSQSGAAEGAWYYLLISGFPGMIGYRIGRGTGAILADKSVTKTLIKWILTSLFHRFILKIDKIMKDNKAAGCVPPWQSDVTFP